MSMNALEKQEQVLQLRAKVLQAEQERMDGSPTLSVSEARKKLKKNNLKGCDIMTLLAADTTENRKVYDHTS